MMFDREAVARAEPGCGSSGGVRTPGIQIPDSLCNSPARPPSRHLSNDRSIRGIIPVEGEMSRPHDGKSLTAELMRSYLQGCSRVVQELWLPLSHAIEQ